MRISTKGRYALRALVDLASITKNNGKCVALREIASRQNMSEKYLENLFVSLKNKGIISSRRGSKGGYYLNDHPKRIPALKVINAIEGPVSLVECCTSDNYCNRTRKCKTKDLWCKINDGIVAQLKNTSIGDLM